MHRGLEILSARRAAELTQKPVEERLKLPTGALGAIERGKILLADEEYERILSVIQELSENQKEEAECDKAALASAST